MGCSANLSEILFRWIVDTSTRHVYQSPSHTAGSKLTGLLHLQPHACQSQLACKGAGFDAKAGEKDHPAKEENLCAVYKGSEAGDLLGSAMLAFLMYILGFKVVL